MKKTIRFAIIPKVTHPWFDEVNKGAQEQAEILGRELQLNIVVDYMAPSVADPEEQQSLLNKALDNRVQGIALDPLESIENITVIHEVKKQNVPLLLFDSRSSDPGLTSIGTNFAEQGITAAKRLLELIDYTGKVAVMQGFPTAPNHKERYDAQLGLLRKYPEISLVEGGIDYDDIDTAFREAAAVISVHPDLKGYLCCDASGPIGIAKAVKESGKSGSIKIVGMDGIKPILQAIKEGLIDSSAASNPNLQGSMSILMLWQASLGAKTPPFIDTGVDLITQENIDSFMVDDE
ncbi:MAG: sugar ABC transporter substrate-binding protein [Saprospirales bacterium]|nr:MAG: sugar ABC transporter substrate-binding protein [Saprospirales bacterium]